MKKLIFFQVGSKESRAILAFVMNHVIVVVIWINHFSPINAFSVKILNMSLFKPQGQIMVPAHALSKQV